MNADPLDQSLSYRDTIPLTWTPLAQPPDAAELHRLQEQNLRVLAVVAALEDRHRPRSEGGETLELEVERLHQKMDMLMILFGQFIRRLDPPAAARAVRLSCRGACWEAGEAAMPPGTGLLALHLHPCMPEPMVWPARLAGSHEGSVCAQFEPLGETLEAALEKHVFLHHRRSVAESRQPAGRETVRPA
jgi:hypothetical protein